MSNINESNYDNEESNIKNKIKEDEEYYNVDAEKSDERIGKKIPNINSKKDLGI